MRTSKFVERIKKNGAKEKVRKKWKNKREKG